MKNIALILASGNGSRCGLEYPKQFAKIKNKTILEYSIEAFENHALITEIIIVTNEVYFEDVNKIVKGLMIESYIEDGSQKTEECVYGKSITDPCLGWEKTEKLIYDLADVL